MEAPEAEVVGGVDDDGEGALGEGGLEAACQLGAADATGERRYRLWIFDVRFWILHVWTVRLRASR
ncbi:MAG: hypothetical protein ACJ78Q_00380 [Chloroflexia bacterium]